MRFQANVAANIKMTAFWDTAPSSPVDANRRFGEKFRQINDE
jgi:hypothetical protein